MEDSTKKKETLRMNLYYPEKKKERKRKKNTEFYTVRQCGNKFSVLYTNLLAKKKDILNLSRPPNHTFKSQGFGKSNSSFEKPFFSPFNIIEHYYFYFYYTY